MSTHPNNNRLVATIVVVVGVILLLKFVQTVGHEGSRRPPATAGHIPPMPVTPPVQNPIARMLEDRSSAPADPEPQWRSSWMSRVA